MALPTSTTTYDSIITSTYKEKFTGADELDDLHRLAEALSKNTTREAMRAAFVTVLQEAYELDESQFEEAFGDFIDTCVAKALKHKAGAKAALPKPLPKPAGAAATVKVTPVPAIPAITGKPVKPVKKDEGKREANNYAKFNGGVTYAVTRKLTEKILFGEITVDMPDPKGKGGPPATWTLLNTTMSVTDADGAQSEILVVDWLKRAAELHSVEPEALTLQHMIDLMKLLVNAGHMKSHAMSLNAALYRLAGPDLRAHLVSLKPATVVADADATDT
jgi:hypothetical protein